MLLVLIAFSTIGYQVVSANEKIDEIKDAIVEQEELETYLNPYGYTIDNPNIIINPYGNSPLTAMILFETEHSQEVTIKILGEDGTSIFENTFEADTKHLIPIYGLLPNTENKVELSCGDIKKIYSLKTEPLPSLTLPEILTQQNDLTIITENNSLYGIDTVQNIRWYLTISTITKPVLLSNNHLLISTANSTPTNTISNLIEIDLMGKIYKQYSLETTYYDIAETETSLFILSNNLIELDKQTGKTLSTYNLTNHYQTITSNQAQNTVTLSNSTEELTINLETKEQTISSPTNISPANNISLNFYQSNLNYKITKAVKFQSQTETQQSSKKILLLNYQTPDETYQKYNIKITKTADNIELTGNFTPQDEVYLILDKFLDKRIYDIQDNSTIINNTGLSGKYSIYLKINNTIYKTNTYIKI